MKFGVAMVTCEGKAGASGDDEEEARDKCFVASVSAAATQVLQIIHHTLDAGLK